MNGWVNECSDDIKTFSLLFPLLPPPMPWFLTNSGPQKRAMSCILGDGKKKGEGSYLYSYCLLAHSVERGKGDNSQGQLTKYFHKEKQQLSPILLIVY